MKKAYQLLFYIFVVILILGSGAPAQAQNDQQIHLSLTKIIGYYSGLLSTKKEAEGTLLLSAEAPSNVTRVVFYIDGTTEMGEVTQPPFKLQFVSESYSLGEHTLTATGYSADGTPVKSNPLVVSFVKPGQGLGAGLKIAGPIILAAILVQLVISLTGQRKLKNLPAGATRSYGVSGGTICPRCHRPFALKAFSPNLGPGLKFARCPYCGRIGLFGRKSMQDLQAAEAAEIADAKVGIAPEESEEEKLRKELESSKYRDV